MPEGIEIRTLDDLPGFQSQNVAPGMQIAPITPNVGNPEQVDMTGITPVYDPQRALDALKGINKAQQEFLGVSADTLQKNTVIQQQLYADTVKTQQETMEAFDRLQRIERNPLADLFAVFDPRTWSKSHQMLDIQKSQLRQTQQSLNAQSMMNINNQLPALKKTQVELQQQGFTNEKDVFGVVTGVADLTNKQIQTRINLADLRIKQSTETRALLDQGVKSLSTEQARAALKLAKAGKGEWVGLEGYLEDKIERDEKADLDAAAIRQNMAKQRFDLAEAQMASFVKQIDFGTGTQLIEQALASGANSITYRGVQVPLATAILGMEDVRKQTESFEQSALARSAYAMDEQLQRLTTQTSALALSGNPRAAQLLQTVRSFSESANKSDPQQMQRLKAFYDEAEKQATAMIKQSAGSYKTPEAKAGFEEFATTGAFTPQGGQAVLTEAIGINSITNRSAFRGTMTEMQKEVARRVDQLNITGAPKFDGSNQSAAQMMSFFMINRNKKVDDIKAEIVSSGYANDFLNQETQAKYRGNAITNVLNTLSTTGPNASTFLNMVRDPKGHYLDETGNIDVRKLATYLVQQSVLTGKKLDYGDAFMSSLRTYSTQADSMTADPTMTVEDQALLAASYGSDPRRNVVSQFVSELGQQLLSQQRVIDEGIRRDISGETQRRAIANMDPAVAVDKNMVQSIISATPSSTGIGTAEDIKAIFGTDPRFGNSVSSKAR